MPSAVARESKPPPLRDLIAESPLVPVALAATIGLLADRYFRLPVTFDILVLIVAAVFWLILIRRQPRAAPVALCIVSGCLAAAWHHAHRNVFRSDDIGTIAEETPKLARLRGVLDEEPSIIWRPRDDPLASYLRPDPTRSILQVREVLTPDGWTPFSGRVNLTVEGHLAGFHVGDEVEVFGWLSTPRGPGNPGEWNWLEFLRDRRIRAELYIRKTPDGVTRLADGSLASLTGWLARLRGWGQRVCERDLPKPQAGIASALLLGEDGAPLTSADWDRYVRTGVIHVLAISGQHFVVLAAFMWFVLKLAGVRRKRAIIAIAIFLLGYALMTGFRPPVQRAAVVAGVGCLSVLMRRMSLPANTFALSWLVVVALSPTDPFGMGCQLAFVQVAVLHWGISRWFETGEVDPMDRLIDESRGATVRFLRGLARAVGRAYLITFILGVVSLPLVASRNHLVTLSAFVIGPPVIILTSIALISGFMMLIAAPIGGILTAPFAIVTRWSLAGSEALVDFGDWMPLGHFYVPDLPAWWVWVFYLALLAWLWCKPLWPHGRWLAWSAAGWLVLGLALVSFKSTSDELRVTFLAVGHGGCTVLETPDGRTLVYDAGAMGGPEVTRRYVAPYLWSRGVRRVDELFLSHADLDHFNGVADLLVRFEVGQVTCTPSFANKELPGVLRTLAAIRGRKIPIRIVQSGDELTAGEVKIDVLHPPAAGPEGTENVRSMVLLVQHRGHSILLTGDLEGQGQALVRQRPIGHVDVLMAPHHGSPAANGRDLAAWAKPALVVVCDGKPRARPKKDDPFAEIQAEVWVTGEQGAALIRSEKKGLTAEAYRSGRRLEIRAK
jgi:competence protein ComEC